MYLYLKSNRVLKAGYIIGDTPIAYNGHCFCARVVAHHRRRCSAELLLQRRTCAPVAGSIRSIGMVTLDHTPSIDWALQASRLSPRALEG